MPCGRVARASENLPRMRCANDFDQLMNDSNRQQLIDAAHLLRPMLNELVFLGGAVTGLLLTDTAAGDPRATMDVDAIAEISTYAEYVQFGARLGDLGFSEDATEGAPVCRWVRQSVILDLMPLDESILGFSNRWYRAAIPAAETHRIAAELDVRIVPAPYFIATKLDAFRGRGQGDIVASKDLEDIVSVLDGRPTLIAEVEKSPAELIVFLRAGIGSLLASPRIEDALAGYLLPDAASQSRIRLVLERLHRLALL